MSASCERDVAKGAIAGAVGGLVASFIMTQFQEAVKKPQRRSEDPATVKVANAVSEKVRSRWLTRREKGPAGSAVHYLFGTAMGSLYGAMAEAAPTARMGAGTLFGSVLWFLADEVAVPKFGLSKSPGEYPVENHVSAWASHLIYGMTTDLVRRGLRAI